MLESDLPAPFWDHIGDLRKTLLSCLITVTTAFIICLYLHQNLFAFLTLPLNEKTALVHESILYKRVANNGVHATSFELPPGGSLIEHVNASWSTPSALLIEPDGYVNIAIRKPSERLMIFSPAEGLVTVLKVCFWVALVGSSPIWLLFIMAFISPALKGKESRFLTPFLGLSILFLAAGMLFAYSFTIPIANHYLQTFNSQIGDNLWSVGHYLDYTVMLILANGLSFESWVILGFLVHFGLVSEKSMTTYRRYVYVGVFILSAILTPPDVITQILLAIPLLVLYEIAVVYARFKSHRI